MYFHFAIFPRLFVSIFWSRTKFIFHDLITRWQECSNVVRVFFRCSCTSNMTFIIHVLQITAKTPSLNPEKGWWWMRNIKLILCITYTLLSTWIKVCFHVLLSPVERIVYTYMYVYDVVWSAWGDESLLVCVSVQWIRGGGATVSVKLCVCGVKTNLDIFMVMH